MIPGSMPPGILTLVRHGETSANLDGVWHGSTDTPLTDRGRAQAERVGAYIGATHPDASALYASPRTRTRDTAAPIARALGLEVQVEPGLAEYDLGEWEGRTYRELAESERLWERMKTEPDFAPRDGESPIQVRDRVAEALRRIEAAHPDERVVVVTHGGALSLVLGDLLDGDYSNWHRIMSNAAVSELQLRPAPHLLSFNYTDHLQDV